MRDGMRDGVMPAGVRQLWRRTQQRTGAVVGRWSLVFGVGTVALSAACAASTSRAGVATSAGATSAGAASRTAGAACFDLSSLIAADRPVAERILLEFSDREGLYTLADGLKPISSDVRDLSIRIAPTPDASRLAQLDQQRRIAAALTCGDIGATVQVFTATQRDRDSNEVRHSSMVVFHRGAVRRLVERQAAFFATLGVTPSTDPREVIVAVENAPRDARWRGYGYLFGYPDDAVDFFVNAGVEGDRTGKLVPRDFRRIATWYTAPAGDGSRLSMFVYAVPKGAAMTPAESTLHARAAVIFRRYGQERGRMIRADSGGAADLWRQWFGTRRRAPT